MNKLAFLILLLSSNVALGFFSGGHRIIAEIAWRQIDETTRAEAVELLKHHPRLELDFIAKMPDSVRNGTQALEDHWLFLDASVWPDYPRGPEAV